CSRWPGTSNSRGLSKGEAWTIVQDRLTLPPSKSQTASGTETHGRGWKHIFANVTQRPVDGDGGSSNTVHIFEQGWPLLCLHGEHWFGDHVPQGGFRGAVWMNRWFTGEQFPVTFMPVPVPFVLNVLAYAASLWLVIVVPRAYRSRRRTKRGLCTNCGYDLRVATGLRCA